LGIDKDNQDDDIYKSCPGCGKLMKWEALICPNCNLRYPEIEFQELRGGMTHPVLSGNNFKTPSHKRPISIALIIILGIAFVSALLMCSVLKIKSIAETPDQSINTAAAKIKVTTTSPATSIAETSTTAAATTTTVKSAYVFSVGDLIDFKGLIITVPKFEKSNGDDFDKPKEGMEYIIVNVKIINKTKDKISYNPFDFKIQNSKMQIIEMADSYTTLETGELAVNEEVKGTVVFEDQKNDPELTLIYQPNFFNGKEVIKISIK
jgi:hypothetical protein